MKIAEFSNTEYGIRTVVMQAPDGLYDVAAFDSDSGLMIEARHGFTVEFDAVAYAQKFTA